ncbi:TatD family hydrolase [Curvibacter sp. PAE-UM]|uniref:TatD family hydrolase n=1 Tax=Curvibacter sp. PAE-UM TaxID=1714344 RepID=UPI00070A4BD1|nr:TatD family hydrolase [Curvibacter sp. PAE-UM]KRH99703.1 DNAase [Curvibacter sp. PAE-UM]
MTGWIDTHCHLDAPEFAPDVAEVRERARQRGVVHCVLPAVQAAHFEATRALAHQFGDSYALGIHPLYVKDALDGDLARLDAALAEHRDDPHLVAVGEIGLDYFVPELCESPLRERQEFFYVEQLRLARKHQLPVILHVRRSADMLLKGLRAVGNGKPWLGIAHAFNGSLQQAQGFIALGLKLGFGGALTYERAQNLRRLAAELPLEAIVLETDAPDMPPHWLYRTAEQRSNGESQGRNEPGELPRIAQVLAGLRQLGGDALAAASQRNACAALPRLQPLLSPEQK